MFTNFWLFLCARRIKVSLHFWRSWPTVGCGKAGRGKARAWPAFEQKKKNTYSLMMCIFIGIAIVRSWSTLKAKCQFHCGSQGIKEDTQCTLLRFHKFLSDNRNLLLSSILA